MAQNRPHQNHHYLHNHDLSLVGLSGGGFCGTMVWGAEAMGDLGLMEQWPSTTPITYLLQLECLQLWTIGHHCHDEHSAHNKQRRDVLARWKYGHAPLRL